MKEVLIDGQIGYRWWDGSGVTAKTVKEQLEGLEDGEEIKLVVNSPGGSVYEGIVIFNLVRDYAKTHPVSVQINCMAMSMASYIALAARTVNRDAKITVCENSIFMIHNPWTFTWGDYRDLKREADYLEKLAALYGSVHAAIAEKSEKEIRSAMDDETYYVGKEIQDFGFANDFEDISQNTDTTNRVNALSDVPSGGRDAIIAYATHKLESTKEKAREAKAKDTAAYRGDLEKAVALLDNNTHKPPVAKNAKTGEKNKSGGLMTLEELRAQNRAVYDEVFAQGETAGVEKERARVNAHLLLGEKSGSFKLSAKFIKAGVSTSDETAFSEYQAAKLDNINLAARDDDDVGDINTGGGNGGTNDDTKLAAAFENGYKNRDEGGNSWAE